MSEIRLPLIIIVSISNLKVGLAKNAEKLSIGVEIASIMGLGVGNSILADLQEQGHIKTQAFSLHLNYASNLKPAH